MSRKIKLAYYLTLLLTSAVLTMELKSSAQRVRVLSESDALTAQASPTPTQGRYNGKIVFISDRHNVGLSIWTMNPDGSNPRRLTDDQSRTERLPSFSHVYDSSPVWSPDGKKIAFISNRNSWFALYTMDADGRNIQLVTDRVLEPGTPAWSPDGRKIALSGGVAITIEPNKPFADIYVVNVDGRGLTKLTSNSGVNGSPTWSPDGRQIAFGSNRDPDPYGRYKIWMMNADGSNQRAVLSGVWEPSSSPDGTKIVFVGSQPNATYGQEHIFVGNADGSNLRQLTNECACDYSVDYSHPRWSPDGSKIVFARRLSNPRRNVYPVLPSALFVMNADGSNLVEISNRNPEAYGDFQPDWQPLASPSSEALPSVLGFSTLQYQAYEDAGSIPVTVMRTGNANGVVACDYSTADGTGIRYRYSVSGTLVFAANEVSKTILIPLDNFNYSQHESFKIKLFNNEGNATFVGGNREATVTILDRDTAPHTKN